MHFAPPRDPTGLLARSPELVALCERSPALCRAVERGRPHDAYRALFWAQKLGKLGDLSPVAATLLAHRRVFFKPLGRSPVMVTYNGVSTSLYGRGDFDPADASYVATLFAVFFFVPIFPIGSYLVRDGERKGLRRSWTFMARIPLGVMTYIWQRGVAVIILLLVVTGAARAFVGYGRNTVHVASGIARPLSVELDAEKGKPAVASLPPDGEIAIETAVGKHTIVVRDGEHVLERGTIDVPRGHGVVVWNVLGTAPLYLASVVYTSKGESPPDEADPKVEFLCGSSLVTHGPVDFLLTDPPQEISMPKGSSSVTRSHLGMARGGYVVCADALEDRGKEDMAARVAIAGATAEQTRAAELPWLTQHLIHGAPFAEGEAFAKGLVARDGSVEAHRIYQDVLIGNGLRDRAVKEYDARREARPGDADAEYLALRPRTFEEAKPRIEASVAKYPDHAFLRHAQIFAHYAAHEYAGVVTAAEALRRLDQALWIRDLTPHVEGLVGLGRATDALALTGEVAADASLPEETRFLAQALGYRAAHAGRIAAPAVATPKGEDAEGAALLLRAITGEELSSSAIEVVRDPHFKGALRVARAAQSNPATAIDLAREAGEEAMQALPPSVRILLLGEVVRREMLDRAPLFSNGVMTKEALSAAIAYLKSGALTDEVLELPIEVRAALDFGRSRARGVSTEEAKGALEQARLGDVFLGPVSAAIAAWPR